MKPPLKAGIKNSNMFGISSFRKLVFMRSSHLDYNQAIMTMRVHKSMLNVAGSSSNQVSSVHGISFLCHLLYMQSTILFFHCPYYIGEIINWVALDYEQQVHHQLLALVTDDGVPRCNATVIAYVTITDLNDNHPCFPQLPSGKELHIKVCSGWFHL